MDDGILQSIKQLLGISADEMNFDKELIVHINTVFSFLFQLGVPPSATQEFKITGYEETWTDFVLNWQMVKTYMFLKIRLMFDPPQAGYLVNSYQAQITELEARLQMFNETTTPL